LVTLRQRCPERGFAYVRGTAAADRAEGRGSEECGQVSVLVALLLPVFLLMGVIVLDIGNWYVHKRHLQTLVDAGALAGATKFVGCSFQFGDPVAANAAVKAAALGYAGDQARDPATQNAQVQEPADVRVVLNSDRYWGDGDPLHGVGLDDTLDHDGDPLTPGDPCSSKTLDVKATDDDAPLLFGLLPLVVDPKSRARVEIRQIKEQAGMLPWAVPDVEPAAVAAIFVDENTGDLLPSPQLLLKQDDVDLPFSEWVTPEGDCSIPGPECVDLASENTGVVILLSRVNDVPSLSGTLTDICGQSPGLVLCYAGDGNQDGLTFIHGWSDIPGEPAVPQIRDVSMLSITCGDDLSAPYFLRSGDCELGATAVIDLGFADDPTASPPLGIGAEVELLGPGCGNGCAMEYVGPASAPNESIWTTTGSATLDPTDTGRQTFSIAWQTESPLGVDHSGAFGGVAHPYVADENSGPVEYLKIFTSDTSPPVPDPNSRNTGPPRSVIVQVGLRKPLKIEDPLAPPILLRVASPSGSQNQAFDCDMGVNFQQEIENGCQTTYALNYDDWSVPKDGIKEWADILCDGYGVGDLPPATIAPIPAPICVAVETGDKIGQFRQGLSKRFETPTCWPNNWPDDQAPPGRGPEDDDTIRDFFTNHDFVNDPRYVTLIVTDYGTFQSQGNDQVPVKYFAGFYATGWDVVGNVKACLDNDPHPWYGTGYRKSLDNGDVWGHFVNIVVFSSSGKPNDELCNFDELGNCIVGLVE
jgi:Putative Flp pilus-assembly TadE/G-like